MSTSTTATGVKRKHDAKDDSRAEVEVAVKVPAKAKRKQISPLAKLAVAEREIAYGSAKRKLLESFAFHERTYLVNKKWNTYTKEAKLVECEWWTNQPLPVCKLPRLVANHLCENLRQFSFTPELVEALKITRDGSYSPFFKYLKEFENYDSQNFQDEDEYSRFKEEVASELEHLAKNKPGSGHSIKLTVPEDFIGQSTSKKPQESITTTSSVPSSTSAAPIFTVLDFPSSSILAVAGLSMVTLTEADVERLCPAETKEEAEDRDDIEKYLSTHCTSEEITRYEVHLSTVATLKKKLTTEHLIEQFLKRGLQVPPDGSPRLSESIFDGNANLRLSSLTTAFVPVVAPFKPKSR